MQVQRVFIVARALRIDSHGVEDMSKVLDTQSADYVSRDMLLKRHLDISIL